MARFASWRRPRPQLPFVGWLRDVGDRLASWIAPLPPLRTDPPRDDRASGRPTFVSSIATPRSWHDHAQAHAAKWIARVRDGDPIDDAEPTRRMRVASRRIRAMLRVLEVPAAEPDAGLGDGAMHTDAVDVPRRDRRLRRIGRRLGALRDLDLAREQAAAARAIAGASLERAALEELEAWLARRRADARDAVDDARDDGGLAEELDGFAAAIEVLADDEPRARTLAGRVLAELAEVLGRDLGEALADDELERLHAVRIAARRLRYLAELFEPCLAVHEREWLARARDLQRAIGSHRDAAQWHELLTQRIARAEHRGRITLARGLEATARAAAEARARAYAEIGPAIERTRDALVRR